MSSPTKRAKVLDSSSDEDEDGKGGAEAAGATATLVAKSGLESSSSEDEDEEENVEAAKSNDSESDSEEEGRGRGGETKRTKIAGNKKGGGGAKSDDLYDSDSDSSVEGDSLPSPKWFDARRVRCLTAARRPLSTGKSVVYWMHREQRCSENWAMLYAKHLADEAGVPLRVAFCLQNKPELGTLRRSGFMLKGLAEVEASLRELHIPFHLLTDGADGSGPPSTAIPLLAAEHSAVAVVCDMSPLRQAVEGAQAVAEALNAQGRDVPLHQVDAHNVVPVWQASNKREVGARTLRKKIMSQDDFFTPFPALTANDKVTNLKALTSSSNVKEEEGGGPQSLKDLLVEKGVDWAATLKGMDIDRSVGEVDWLTPGTAAGKEQVGKFIKDGRLKAYGNSRNDPNVPAQSDLSPYLNFGQLSAQWAALTVKECGKYPESVKDFVEESVVRRELADNFCFYCAEYDSLDAAAGWARETLSNCEGDEREHLYSLKQLEQAETHEDLWNAGQLQLVRHGKMHGWVRMYWAKKILEWTPSPAEALRIGLLLNDKYSLDGQDPNGFTGLGWSIMGIHDMGWTPRPIFGKIRYMNYKSTKTKFDIHAYVNKFPGAADKATAAGGTPARPKGERKSKGKGGKKEAGKGGGKGGSKGNTAEEVLGLRKQLDKAIDAKDMGRVGDIVSALGNVGMTFDLLKATKIGLSVNKVKKLATGEVKALAKDLIKKWKAVAEKAGQQAKVATPGMAKGGPAGASSSSSSGAGGGGGGGGNGGGGEGRGGDDDNADIDESVVAGPRMRIIAKLTEALKEGDNSETARRLSTAIELLMHKTFQQEPQGGGDKAYNDKARSLLFNLRKNEVLRNHVLESKVAPLELVGMSDEQLATKEQREAAEADRKEEFDARRGDYASLTATDNGMFACERCQSRKTIFRQLQTRSADEPMTTIITCLECQHRYTNDDH